MKLKEVFYGLGFRPGLREYPFDISSFELPKEGVVEFARWQHPSARRRDRAGGGFRLTQAMVDTHRAFLDAGDVAIDIGAHTGDSSIPIALAVGVKGAVFALEPNLYAYKVLLANCALNRTKTNIFPLNIAATPEDGSFEFEYSDPGFCNGGFHAGIDTWKHAHFFKLKVTGRHLPNFLSSRFPAEAARVRYIKIDTEGFDRAVAASLRSILIEKKPYLKTEMYKHTPESERRGYYRDLRELGYALYKIESDEQDYRARPLPETDIMKWSHYDVFAVPER
ncbi:MAG TPA: FkbM family methyltransferase [Gemmatimonadaceae bacterium]|nr:FkbM family methyltransferase [Gemmatimonadaceae bacterium]